MRPGGRLGVLLGLALTGCTALLGVNDVFYDPSAPVPGPDGSVTSTDGAVVVPDGAPLPDAASCGGVDLSRDDQNCGRCAHACGGGKCEGGVCQPLVLAEAPRLAGLATDGQALYATSYTGRKVLRIEKTPGVGAVKALAEGFESALGVAVAGNTLYVTRENSSSGNGGLYSCPLPACTTLTRITPLDFPRHLALSGSSVFVPTEGGVFRTALDGSSPKNIATYSQPFSLAADATQLYVVSLATQVYRIGFDGAGEVAVGPRPAPDNYGFVALGDDLVVWAYVDEASKKGQVVGAKKSAVASQVTYTSNGVGSTGVAVDGTYVYWSDRGNVVGSGGSATYMNDGTLNACPRAGCPTSGPIVLAKGLHGAGPIVLDDAFVYFAELGLGTDGIVRKVAKP